jgi:multidrug efflux system membrane fusion protein
MRVLPNILINLVFGVPIITAAAMLSARQEEAPQVGTHRAEVQSLQTEQSQNHSYERRGDMGGPVPVLVESARREDVPVYLDGLGTIKALNTAVVRAQVDGQLVKISFREGQDVPRGYVLAEIDPRTYQAQLHQTTAKLAQDQAQLANAKLDLDR